MKQYFEELTTLSNELEIEKPTDILATLLRLPDVMKQDIEEIDEEEWGKIESAVDHAADELISFRIQEGKMLQNVMIGNIENIRALLDSVAPYENERIEKIKSRIYDNLSQLNNAEYDNSRFEQEMIFYVEKLDINEEKSRLSNHLDYFIKTLKEDKAQGKKLGFITQEIGREINTLGSKSNHFEMQKIVVQMKDELEQVKEQILNVL